MKKENIIAAIKSQVDMEGGIIFVDDVWVNNSDDFEGEDLEVSSISVVDGEYGVYVGCDNDFFILNELDIAELEELYDAIF